MKYTLVIISLCPFLSQAIGNDKLLRSSPVQPKEMVELENLSKKLVIQEDDKLEFKAISSNDDETIEYYQTIAFLASKNEISIDEEAYSFDEIEEFSIWSSNEAKVYLDAKDLAKSHPRRGRSLEGMITQPRFYFGKHRDVELLVSQNILNERIEVIEIFNASSVTTLVPIDLATPNLNNYSNPFLDEDMFNLSQPSLHYDTIEDYGMSADINGADDNSEFIFMAQGSCGVYRQIEVTVAFDSSFCSFMGGFDAAVQRVQYIVALASNKYHQASLCLSVKLAAIDGRCNVNDDPYSKMNYWQSGCIS